NKNMIPFDPSTPDKTSGVRLGTPAATSRGFKEPQMAELAGYIADIMEDYEGNRARVLAGVERLCKEFPIYEEAGMQW
ncbi:MAG: serine hydroxymethyltransferase, partial [Eubacterium sp.]|nr:serine hydroxymethyltransferase [Eubacterium sp.]